METVILKNGAVEAKSFVVVATMSIEHLIATNVIAFYELVQVCRNPSHTLFGNTSDILKGLKLLEQDGRVHDSIRNVVLSGTNGDGLDLCFGSPVGTGL